MIVKCKRSGKYTYVHLYINVATPNKNFTKCLSNGR